MPAQNRLTCLRRVPPPVVERSQFLIATHHPDRARVSKGGL